MSNSARRRLARGLGLLGAGLLLLLAVAVAALHVGAVQRALFERAATELEARTGLRLEAESIRLSPLRARLQLTRATVAAGAAEPFLAVERVTARLAPGSLVGGPLILRELLLVAPRLDGTRPLPELPQAAADGAEPLALELESLQVQDASATGFAPPEPLRAHLEEAEVEGLWLEGELVDGRLRLDWEGARLRVQPGWRPPLEAGLEGRLAGPLAGPLRLERMVVDGEELSVDATGWLGTTPEQPLAVEFEAQGDAAGLLGSAAGPGPVRVAGRLDLRAMRGEVRFAARGLPGELALPWVGEELLEQAALSGSRLHLAGDLSLDGDRVAGTAEGRWSRGGTVLARTDASVAAELSAAELPVDLRLELLPGDPGSRRLEARLLLPREDPAAGRIAEGRLGLALPDLEAGLSSLREQWPAWVPELPAGLAAGPLRLDGRLAGGLADPSVRLEGAWTPAPGADVRLTGGGSLATRRLEGKATLARLPLGRFVDGGRGTLAGSAAVESVSGALTGELELAGEGVGTGSTVLDSVRLAAVLDGRRIGVGELAATQAGRELRASGELLLEAAPAADLDFEMTGEWGPVRRAAGTLRLERGRLLLKVPSAELAEVTASLSAVAPLETLAGLPGAEALRDLPLGAVGGPLEIAWQQPPVDWRRALSEEAAPAGPPSPEGAPRDRWVVGSSGRLVLDPSSLGTAAGEVEITVPEVGQSGHSLRGLEPLELTLAFGRLTLAPAAIEVDGRPAELSGEARLLADWSPRRPPEELVEEARLALRAPASDPVEAVDLALRLSGSGLELTVEAPLRDGGTGRLAATAPLEAVLGADAGRVAVSWELPEADWSGWLTAPGGGEPGEEGPTLDRLTAGTTGSLVVDLERPALAVGELRISGLEADLAEQTLRTREPLALRVGEGRLTVESARLLASGAPLELAGGIDLEPGWRLGQPATELVRELALEGGGILPAALLNPFLEGGAGEGALLAELEVSGPRETARGEVRIDGRGAGIHFVSPYALEIAAPELTVRVAAGAATFEGSARLNEGVLSFTGEADRDGGVDMRLRLEEVRALLDYGLLTLLDGDLKLTVAPDGKGLLAGTVTVDRGQLTRPIRLESLLVEQLLPADLLGTELDPLEAIALELRLETRQGVRVRNNLADLKVRWEPVAVRGNPVQPIIEGRLEADPGGLIYAYGQTVRLDSAALVYRGLPRETPTLELQTTTSLEDPSIGRLAGDDAFAEERRARREEDEEAPGAGAVAGEALTTGLASFLGEQLSGSVGEALGGTRISFRPLLIFGEADPGARLTAASDLSARVTLAASVDLGNAERQTYLLDLHDERAAARLSAQLFTNDLGNEGGTLQQRLEFGGVDRRADGPRLRGLEIDRVPGVRRRALKRAVGYRKGQRLEEGAAFEIAVAVGQLLRDRGYPDARVWVEEAPPPRRRGTALAVRIESGPHVEFRFTGEELPKSLRRSVAQLYRGDFYEPRAIEEMRDEAVRAWRSRGYLEPEVEIRRQLQPGGGPPERRLVTVESRPGARIDPAPPRFAGLPPAESAELGSLFSSTLRRVELAAGLPAAERRARQGLAALGYPEAVLAGRRLSPDGRQLTIEVEPGERLRVGSLELLEAGGLSIEVSEAGGVEAGDPVRADLLSRAALEVESELRAAGYLDAQVTLRLEPLGAARPAERKAVFELDKGRLYRLAQTEFAGLGATRPSWARRRAALADGEPLAPGELRDARRRLYGTGLFSAVGTGVEAGGDGARVLFEVEEQPRFRLAYGLRWESEQGTSVVLDTLDRNFLGRGVDLGLRALWSEDLQQLRLSGSVPDVVGLGSRLEVFALAEEEMETLVTGQIVDNRVVEGTVQLGWPLGPRTTGRVYGRYRDGRSRFELPVIGTLEVRSKRPSLGLQYIFDGRDGRLAAGRGLFASLDLSFSDESIGGDIRYARLFGQLHIFRPAGRLAGRRLTWAQSVRLGRAQAFSGQQLADDLLLLAGGEYSVRGYRRESLGPPRLTSGLGVSTEHNSLLVLNEELRFEIWDLLSGLLFVDAGNVWLDDDSDFELFTSLGLGLRADTPFGLMRLDVAWPLDRREGIDSEVKLYFGLGNVF